MLREKKRERGSHFLWTKSRIWPRRPPLLPHLRRRRPPYTMVGLLKRVEQSGDRGQVGRVGGHGRRQKTEDPRCGALRVWLLI
ncbi:hypothetical protein ES332_A06G058700v1 [Gossypium tomentosum]|uniref:Uncharacterized protein n=1 Tax=Gossypium tomentosum TaxID=34277 RepID=A0A5D2Q0V7_GOSTO|nr:hypothetical protein ES332_A06G058700v1 [Gossypium tomentosum]